MRTLRVVTGMIAVAVIGAQTMRHVYVRWIEPRQSVLDRYQSKTQEGIAAAENLAELEALYEVAWKAVKVYEVEHPLSPGEEPYSRLELEPYKNEMQLKSAIATWETQSHALFELHVFWWFGIACVALGVAASLWINPWLGWAIVILGYLEMQWATCPSFRAFGAQVEFDRLLTWKAAYSVMALFLVLGAWEVFMRVDSHSAPAADAKPTCL